MRHVAPLSEPVFLILLSLAAGPRHGYGLLKEVKQLSDGRVSLSTGTLYGALGRMLDDEWIEQCETSDSSRDKQSYRLTAIGRRFLQMELDRMTRITETAKARLRPREI